MTSGYDLPLQHPFLLNGRLVPVVKVAMNLLRDFFKLCREFCLILIITFQQLKLGVT